MTKFTTAADATLNDALVTAMAATTHVIEAEAISSAALAAWTCPCSAIAMAHACSGAFDAVEGDSQAGEASEAVACGDVDDACLGVHDTTKATSLRSAITGGNDGIWGDTEQACTRTSATATVEAETMAATEANKHSVVPYSVVPSHALMAGKAVATGCTTAYFLRTCHGSRPVASEYLSSSQLVSTNPSFLFSKNTLYESVNFD